MFEDKKPTPADEKKKPRPTILVEPTFASDELAACVLQEIVGAAQEGSVKIDLQNASGQPFKVVTEPEGAILWGIGGCGVDL